MPIEDTTFCQFFCFLVVLVYHYLLDAGVESIWRKLQFGQTLIILDKGVFTHAQKELLSFLLMAVIIMLWDCENKANVIEFEME